MKGKLIWRTVITDTRDDAVWWGTCSKWVAESLAMGYKIKSRQRVLWVGKAPECWSCDMGTH